MRVQPSGPKAFIINYRTRSGRRRARNRRVAIGRCDHLAPEEARRFAQELLRVEHGAVRSRADVVAALEAAGFEVPRQGKDYLTARDPDSGKRAGG